MEYYLMHGEIKVLKMIFNHDFEIAKILEVYEVSHMPVGTDFRIKELNSSKLKEWWNNRRIPFTRDAYQKIFSKLIDDTSASLVIKSHALSLTDQYWVKRVDEEDATYQSISFFTNRFNEDLGDLLIGNRQDSKNVNYYSPDATSTGNLVKRWKRIDGVDYLIKSGTEPYRYEVFGEIIASEIMRLLDIGHVEYTLFEDNEKPYCKSPNYIKYSEDFVSAFELYNNKQKKNDESTFEHLLEAYKQSGLTNYRTKLNMMFFVDFLVGNTDRHLNNFGLIKDARNHEYVRVAPIYDTGACLGFDKTDRELELIDEIDWKPFKSKHIKSQLQLIDDFSWLDISKLKEIPNLVATICDGFSKYISFSRRNTMLTFLVKRINEIYRYLGVKEVVSYSVNDSLSLLEKGIVLYLQKHGGTLIDLDELMKEFNRSYITIYRSIQALVSKNILVRVGSKKTGYWKLK